MIFTEGVYTKDYDYEYVPFVPNYVPRTSSSVHKIKINPKVAVNLECPYCHGQADLMQYSEDGAAYIHRNKLVFVDGNGIAVIQINYCPMCRREL